MRKPRLKAMYALCNRCRCQGLRHHHQKCEEDLPTLTFFINNSLTLERITG